MIGPNTEFSGPNESTGYSEFRYEECNVVGKESALATSFARKSGKPSLFKKSVTICDRP
jgi:hypothetical protein